MDEYQLIEIAKRFRALEDIAEFAGGLLPRESDQAEEFTAEGMSDALEACRDDMNAMQEALRKCGGVK